MEKTNLEKARELDGKPSLAYAIPLGLQHVLAMFVSNLTPILIIGGIALGAHPNDTFNSAGLTLMIQCAMLTSGLVTLVQLYPIKIGGKIRIGSGLPIVMGVSFAFVGVGGSVAAEYGMAAVAGAAIVGALLEVFAGFTYKYIKRLFNPLVTGTLLIALGLYLINVGANYFVGGYAEGVRGSKEALIAATITLLVSLGLSIFGKGLVKTASILIAIFVGTIASMMLGVVDYGNIGSAGWFSFPLIPFKAVGKPEFIWAAIIPFLAVYFATTVETIGDTNGVALGGFDREATEEEIAGGLLADGFGSMFSTAFNALPNTSFGQNVGIVTSTKVVSKFVIATGAIFLIFLSFFPKFAAIFRIIPDAVLGGALLPLFAIIVGNGIKMLAKAGFSDKNMLIITVSLGLGLGLGGNASLVNPETGLSAFLDNVPAFVKVIFDSSVAATAIISLLLSLIIKPDYSKGDYDPDKVL